ncbi:MAG: nicotinate phosphoribosyltransferase [Thaumarchaeota archaeon]|nr:nicotinate phosphoribosyltransferase [Candidatus Calditenuaceae archaeon]MDW8043567.1 nicotinate phosphoribosyltransferase [Nitrososphaerota archaeon]
MSLRPKIYCADERTILEGRVTDVYFLRTEEIVRRSGLGERRVCADVHSYGLPEGYSWAVFAGLEEALKLLEGRRVNVYAMEEGEVFRPMEPVMEIEGPYAEFGVLESSILGALRHESSVATKAARVRLATWGKLLVFFGIRCVHPAVAPAVDRAAFIGGCDAVSGVLGAEMLGERPVGTMPHALIILFGDQEKAWMAFDEVMPPEVPRIALCDTFDDERVESLKAARALGRRLHAVRLDTPSSRRGNMRAIVEEVKWTLRVNGYDWVGVFVSGGIDEEEAKELVDVADGFGVGTSIAFPPSVDLAMDIVEVDGSPLSKRGKLPGRKQVYRCERFHDTLVPRTMELERCPTCGGEVRPLLRPVMLNGELVKPIEPPREIRERVIKRLSAIREMDGQLPPVKVFA